MYIYTIINRWIYLEEMEDIDVIDDMEEMGSLMGGFSLNLVASIIN